MWDKHVARKIIWKSEQKSWPCLLPGQVGTWRELLQVDLCHHQCLCRTDKPETKLFLSSWVFRWKQINLNNKGKFCQVVYFFENGFTWTSLNVAPSIVCTSTGSCPLYLTSYPVFNGGLRYLCFPCDPYKFCVLLMSPEQRGVVTSYLISSTIATTAPKIT